MKKLAFFLFLITVFLTSFDLRVYAGKIEFKTIIHRIDNQTVHTRTNNFDTLFFGVKAAKDTIHFSKSYDVISPAHFKVFHDVLKGMEVSNDTDFFYVLRIFYGLDAKSRNIKLIILPDVAVRPEGDGHKDEDFKFRTDITNIDPNVYVSGNFSKAVKYSSVQSYIQNYKSMMYVKPLGRHSDSVRPVKTCEDLSCDASFDAHGIIFPFQEFEDLFDLSGNSPIYIINVAEMNEMHGNNFYKHGIAFSSATPGDDPDAVSANLGGLCPPRCDVARVILVENSILAFLRRFIFNPSLWGEGFAMVAHWLITLAFTGFFAKKFFTWLRVQKKNRKE